MPAFRLGRKRKRSTSRSASTRLASRPCTKCFECAPARALGPQPRLRPPPCMPLRIVSPPFDSRQGAAKFNQPLSFDTSKVTDMGTMFYVCSPRAPSSTALSRPHLVHAAFVAATQCPPGPNTSSRIACPPFDSADRDGVQPSAQLRHVQGHGHEPDVHRALRACPAPPQPWAGPSPCMPPAPPPPNAPTPPAPHLFPQRMPAFRLGRAHRRSTSRSASTRPASQP